MRAIYKKSKCQIYSSQCVSHDVRQKNICYKRKIKRKPKIKKEPKVKYCIKLFLANFRFLYHKPYSLAACFGVRVSAPLTKFDFLFHAIEYNKKVSVMIKFAKNKVKIDQTFETSKSKKKKNKQKNKIKDIYFPSSCKYRRRKNNWGHRRNAFRILLFSWPRNSMFRKLYYLIHFIYVGQ